MRVVIFGYFGTLTDPGAEEYREPLAHRTGELLGGCRPRFWEALAGSFGEPPGPVCLPPSVGLSASDSAGWQYGALPVVRADLDPADVERWRP
jgi:hypothetical protein